jgi:hypothetical protein
MPSNKHWRVVVLVGILAAATAEADPENAPPKTPDTYGSGHISFYRVGFSEFVPAESALTYSDIFFFTNGWARYATSQSLLPFVAVPHLPSGALVSAVEFDWCDTNAVDDASFEVDSTLYTGQNSTPLASTTSNGSSGCEYSIATLSAPFTVDNNHTQLILTAFLPVTDSSIAIAGAIVQYTLQVSDPPDTPSFSDVPTSHPFFRFVEALAASGITAGCAPGKYCPNDPVTRGQMAVFLAKALGLEFP